MAVLSKGGYPTCPNHGVGSFMGGDSSNMHTVLMIYISFIGLLWRNNQIDYQYEVSEYTPDNLFM